MLAVAQPTAFAQVDESALKAAFVYNIVAFSHWSEERDTEALVICTAATEPLNAAIARLADRMIGRRRIAVHSPSLDTVCDVFVHTHGTNPAVAGKALVICDGCQLPNGVTAVTLVREGNRIRFDVDPAAAAEAGIGFSSQLLRLARRIK